VKIIKTEFLIRKGTFQKSPELKTIIAEVENAILSVTYPVDSSQFTLYPGKHVNGVVPIKKNFLDYLVQYEWLREHRMSIASRLRPGPIDAVKKISNGLYFAIEWETGNISSSHRALNKMAVGLLTGYWLAEF
jgi:hypothetical protein